MSYPKQLPKRYRRHWNRPWRAFARRNPGFKRWLRRHGRLSPHFTLAEAACKDGTPLPQSMVRRAQRHAFRLEKLRHRLGDKPLAPLSWYRSPAHNAAVGGATQSRHMQGDATDFSKQTLDRVGRERFLREANHVFRTRGLGTYPSGSAHVDSRPWYARWFS